MIIIETNLPDDQVEVITSVLAGQSGHYLVESMRFPPPAWVDVVGE